MKMSIAHDTPQRRANDQAGWPKRSSIRDLNFYYGAVARAEEHHPAAVRATR